MVRLVFRPYTQVRRTICTSVSLRASTRVSSGFALLRHSSPSFGSQQACSHSNLSQQIVVGGRCTREGFPPLRFLSPRGLGTHRLACMLNSSVRVSRRAGWRNCASVPRHAGTQNGPAQKGARSWSSTAAAATRGDSNRSPPQCRSQQPTLAGSPRPTTRAAAQPPSPLAQTGVHDSPPSACLSAISSTL
jgi:hypothetical protein